MGFEANMQTTIVIVAAAASFALLVGKACPPTTPPPPARSVVLKWDPSPDFVPGISQYRLYRGSPDCAVVHAVADKISDNTYTDTHTPPGTYCYQVSAVDTLNLNESKLSNEVVVPVP